MIRISELPRRFCTANKQRRKGQWSAAVALQQSISATPSSSRTISYSTLPAVRRNLVLPAVGGGLLPSSSRQQG